LAPLLENARELGEFPAMPLRIESMTRTSGGERNIYPFSAIAARSDSIAAEGVPEDARRIAAACGSPRSQVEFLNASNR
jgi:hypothetical protein